MGLVAFSHKSVVLANLTETDEEGKAMLLDRLPEPERIGGGTSIAKGKTVHRITSGPVPLPPPPPLPSSGAHTHTPYLPLSRYRMSLYVFVSIWRYILQ